MRMHYLLIVFFSFGLVACGGGWSDYPQSTMAHVTETSVVKVGDSVSVSVFGEPQVSGDYAVLNDGTINLPLAGKISIVGRSLSDTEGAIKDGLVRGGYLLNPKVTVKIPQNHKIYVLGEVVTSGEYDYRANMTILDLVATAKGFSYRANQDRFDIIRTNADGTEVHISGDVATRLMPGDTVRVRERYF
jgi:polysaccharide export outer membrane protein